MVGRKIIETATEIANDAYVSEDSIPPTYPPVGKDIKFLPMFEAVLSK